MNLNRIAPLAVFAVSVALLTAVLPVSTAEATRQEARRVAWANSIELSDAGYSFSTARYGYLRRNGYVIVPVTLYQGVKYAFLGAGCNDAYDVDLYLVNRDRSVIAHDERIAQWALVKGQVSSTGRYFVVVHMASSTPDGAHYVLNIGIK